MPEITDTRLRTLKKCSYVMGVTVTLRVRTVPPVEVGFWIFSLHVQSNHWTEPL